MANRFYITANGQDVLTNAVSSGGLEISGVYVGSGTLSSGDDPETFTALKSVEGTGTVDEFSVVGNQLTIVAGFRNEGVLADFTLHEVGIFCKNALNQSVLCFYGYLDDGQTVHEYVAGSVVEIRRYSVVVALSGSVNVSITAATGNYTTLAQVNSLLALKQGIPIVEKNYIVSSWSSDVTYSGYPYAHTITVFGCTADSPCEVIFGHNEALSGNYSPICESLANGVKIWSKVNTSITIPTVIVWG